MHPSAFMTERVVSRLAYAVRWSLGHLLVSILVAAFSAVVVFGLWYPAPWRDMLGVAGIFMLVVVADVVCGPLLTFVLASPRKSKRERWLDLSIIGLIQIAALVYGLHAVFSGRPVMLVFEVDRFVIVTANEVQTDELARAPDKFQRLPWWGVRLAGLRQPTSSQEYLESIEMTLNGVPQPMRPNWWHVFDERVRTELLLRAKPVSELMSKQSDERDRIEKAIANTGLNAENLWYLPLTSSKSLDWTILLDGAGTHVGHAKVDAFH